LTAGCVEWILGIPQSIRAGLFDLDGVLTNTAAVHAAAWKQVFDAFLREREGDNVCPFEIEVDYVRYVDGKPRENGVREFLASRGINLPEGQLDDDANTDTVRGLACRKDALLMRLIARDGVQVFPGSVLYLRAAQDSGLHRIVVSSSANADLILHQTGLEHYVEGCIDGVAIARRHIPGKPAPDSFFAAAELAGVAPAQAAVFEDALAGVAAGRAGGFGCVVGVDRTGHADQLKAHGADVVVSDLADLLQRRQ
jgi:beta-phosphoglucomutase family hydrolase